MCAGPVTLYHPGTADPKEFFERGVAYAVAAGGDKERLPIYRCVSCGHGFTPVNFDPHIIVRWYAGYEADHIFLAQEAARRRTGRQVLGRIEKLLSTRGKLLDIGAGPGLFLAEAKKRGWRVAGIEPSAWAVDHAQKDLQVSGMRQGDVGALPSIPAQSFDCVVAFDVIEHLVGPKKFLAEANRILKPGGLLVMATPRFDSLLAKLMGRRWYCIFPAHIHYFTRRSMNDALKKAGFTVAQEKTHTRYLGLGYVWQRLLDYVNISPLPKRERGGTPPAGGGVRGGRRDEGIIIPVNFGDEFEIYARKA